MEKPEDKVPVNETTKASALLASKSIDIESVKTVCLALGPYRNLTTVTASILFLHPDCQVLNHAGQRIFGVKELDFIKEYSDERFETFLRYAIYISQGGVRGITVVQLPAHMHLINTIR